MWPTDEQLLELKTKNLLKTFRSSDLHQFTVQHWNKFKVIILLYRPDLFTTNSLKLCIEKTNKSIM